MGKLKVPENVDLKEATIGGSLLQIRRSNSNRKEDEAPLCTEMWICLIDPTQTKSILKFIEVYIKPLEKDVLTNIKRFKKELIGDKIVLLTVLCSKALFNNHENLLGFLRKEFCKDLPAECLRLQLLPIEIPSTKEIAQLWSETIWPISWKGNPNHQDLITARFNLSNEENIIREVISLTKSSQNNHVSTIIAQKDEETGEITILFRAQDSRNEHPLNHSVMNAISQVAEDERRKRAEGLQEDQYGYLCQNLLVYTSHEPCTMCLMALVHSRIQQLVYIWKHPFGGIESSHFIGDRNDLNWTFDIWRWVGPGSKEIIHCPEEIQP